MKCYGMMTLSETDDIIKKSEYAGNQNLEIVKVPRQIKKIEQWAFYKCKNLVELWMPKSIASVESNFLDGCEKLEYIYLYEEDEAGIKKLIDDEVAHLFAFEVLYFNMKELLNFSILNTKDWYIILDEKLLAFIKEPDEKDFDPFLAGGEEDYEDPLNDINMYRHMRRMQKIEGILKRLAVREEIHEKEQLVAYMKKNLDILAEYIESQREKAIFYIRICDQEGIIDLEAIDDYIKRFDGAVFTEVRAYLLNKKLGQKNENQERDFFSTFDL